MRHLRDVVWVAASAMRARPVRTILMCVGPLLGVAVIVGAFGILESAEGDVRASLRDLGDDLIIVSAPEGARLPMGAPARVESVNAVDRAAGIGIVDGAVGYAISPVIAERPVSFSVYASDAGLAGTLDVALAWGRELGPHDESHRTRAAVVGSGVAESLGFDGHELLTVFVNEMPLGVVGVLEPSTLAPVLDSAILITHEAAARVGGQGRSPGYDFLYVRAERAVERTASVLPVAVTYGERGAQPRVDLPVQLLQAQVAIDQTLAGVVIGFGVLAMAIGGFGIANVMTIAVMERQREIGVRRALGHRRLAIAMQFLAEGAIVGVAGGIAGAVLASGLVWIVAQARGWVFIATPTLAVAAVAAGFVLTLIASIYPAARAARLEPLAALHSS